MMDITDKSHEGEYQCKASNVEGDAVRKIKLTVTGKIQKFYSFSNQLPFNLFIVFFNR